MVVPANDLEFIDHLWADWSPGYDGAVDIANVKDALRDPANLTAALGYYRATLGDGVKDPALDEAQGATSQFPTQPTLYLHGRNDGCIGAEVAELAASMAPPNVTFEIVDGAGHFLHLEQPDHVNQRIIEFLG
jgi:pimeloyl-ACP methyl ester carboxylesterase